MNCRIAVVEKRLNAEIRSTYTVSYTYTANVENKQIESNRCTKLQLTQNAFGSPACFKTAFAVCRDLIWRPPRSGDRKSGSPRFHGLRGRVGQHDPPPLAEFA